MNGNNNESINKVTAKSYGNLDTVETEKECWMIRIPPKLASAWEDCPPGSILGELVFRKGGGKGPNLKKIKPSLEVHVDPNIINNGSGGDCGPTIQHQQQQLPLHYSLQAMTKKLPTLHPLRSVEKLMVQSKYTEKFRELPIYRPLKTLHIAPCTKVEYLPQSLLTTVCKTSFDCNQVVQQSKSNGTNTNKHMNTASKSTAKQGFGDAVHLLLTRI